MKEWKIIFWNTSYWVPYFYSGKHGTVNILWDFLRVLPNSLNQHTQSVDSGLKRPRSFAQPSIPPEIIPKLQLFSYPKRSPPWGMCNFPVTVLGKSVLQLLRNRRGTGSWRWAISSLYHYLPSPWHSIDFVLKIQRRSNAGRATCRRTQMHDTVPLIWSFELVK